MNSLTIPNTFLAFKYDPPILNATKILSYSDDLTGTGTIKKEFRWSSDNKSYSSWTLLTDDELRLLSIDPANTFYIEFKYTLLSPGTYTISNVSLNYDSLNTDSLQGFVPTGFSTATSPCCFQKGSPYGLVIEQACSGNTFDPYQESPIVGLFADIIAGVNNMFGIPIKYFRAVPDERSEDVIFKEWSLYGVDKCKDVKILVPNNEFPDNVPLFNPWGIDFEQPFEIQIITSVFESIYGANQGPQKRDMIYIPTNNVLYDVLSAYPFRDVMMKQTYWKVNLKKHADSSARYMDEETETFINELTKGSDEIFGQKVNDDTLDIVKPQQFSRTMGTERVDPTRLSVKKGLRVIDGRLDNNGTIISEHWYDLASIFAEDERYDAVIYKPEVHFNETSELGFSCWFEHKDPVFYNPKTNVINISVVSALTYNIEVENLGNITIGSSVGVVRPGNLSFFGQVTAIPGNNIMTVIIPQFVVDFLNKINSSWYLKPGYVAEKAYSKNFIDGHDGTNGWKLESMIDRFYILTMNDKLYSFITNTALNDDWYGIYLNVSNKFKQVNFNVWKRNEPIYKEERTTGTELTKIFSKTYSGIEPEDRSSTKKYELVASSHNETNIRIFNETAEEEKQSNILNRNIVKDSSLAIIIDNALPTLNLPWFGRSK